MVSRKGNAQKGATKEDIMGRGSSKAGKGGGDIRAIVPNNSITKISGGYRIDGTIKSRKTRKTLRSMGYKQYAGEPGHSYWTNQKGHKGRELPNFD